MSRIGKKPILILDGVEVEIDNDFIFVKGPKGELKIKKHPHVKVVLENKEINISMNNEHTRVQ